MSRRVHQFTTGDATERLTSEQRHEARLDRLAAEVRQACDRFLASRNLPLAMPFMDYQRQQTTKASTEHPEINQP